MRRLIKLIWFLVTLGPVRRLIRRTFLYRAIRFTLLASVAAGLVVLIAVMVRQMRKRPAAEGGEPLTVEASRPATLPPPPPDVPSESKSALSDDRTDPDAGACPTSHPVKAVKRSGIYHDTTSRWYEKAKADVCFESAEAAERAGFRPPGKKSS